MSERIVDAVVFDIGGVLVDWSPDYLYARVIPDEAERARFLAEVATPQWNQQQDAGRTWAEAVEELVARHPEHTEWIQAYDVHWLETVKGLYDDTVEVLRELRANGVPTYALTNFSAEKWEVVQEAFPVLTEFDGVVVSGVEKTIKPDEKIYRILLERYSLDAGRTFYTDDVQHNVDAARSVGLDAELFTDAPTLRTHLHTRGLPINP